MSARPTATAFRVSALALVAALALSGFDAAAEQRPVAVPAGSDQSDQRPPYASTEDDAEARLDGSSADTTGGIATDVPNAGLVYEGLKRTGKRTRGCRGAFQGRAADGKRICTHGPDPAPRGVDASRRPHAKELKATTTAMSSSARSVPCYGDGTSGPRVQAIYAHSSEVPDRSSSIVPLIPQWAANADAAFFESAAQTGGRRHVLWETTPGCALNVDTVRLSPAGDDSLTNTINELKAMGYTRTDRKYMVWMDAARYCGIAEIKDDDQPGAANVHNFGPMFGRIDTACWGAANSTEAHELMHMLGGIQLSAPHSSAGWHCTDENDRMCLPDLPGLPVSYGCPATNEPFFDCGHDDYFSTTTTPGSYLATHWNAANSVFLSAAVPDSCWTAASGTSVTRRKRRGARRKGSGRRDSVFPAPSAPAPATCTAQ